MKSPAVKNAFIKRALNKRLLDASRDANIYSIRNMLESGADPNVKNKYGYTPILLLCGHPGFESANKNVLEGLRLLREAGGSMSG